ncbi:MAG: hypothetical protein J5830_05790 [Clostridia bacterium]|nr:hypothetical protein [Clostridia bacterium]
MERNNIVTCFLIVVLAASVLLASCNSDSNEIYSTPDRAVYSSLSELISDFKNSNRPFSLALGTVDKITYRLSWSREDKTVDGCSVAVLNVERVDESNNVLHVSPGSEIIITSDNYYGFVNGDESEFLRFASHKTGKKLNSLDDLYVTDDFTIEFDSGETAGMQLINRGNSIAFEEGKTYSFLYNGTGCSYVYPAACDETEPNYEEDILIISKEIASLFSDGRDISE